MVRKRLGIGRSGLGLLASVAALAACAGGPQFNGTEYRDDDLAFRVGPLPAGYERVNTDESRLAFTAQDGAALAINARCRLDGDDVPLRALVQHLFLQFTERTQLSERAFQLDGRDALEVELNASLDGVPRHFLVTVLKKDGCVYDFVLVEAVPGASGNTAAYHALVDGFRTLD